MPAGEVVLGLNLFGNDTSAALVRKRSGEILAVAEEERYSRIKGGRRWASPRWVMEVVREFGVDAGSVTGIGCARIQSLHRLRQGHGRATDEPGVDYWQDVREASLAFLVQRLPGVQVTANVRHHLCHAASAFYPSPFRSAAVVTADGVGEFETTTIWSAADDGLRAVWRRELPHSLGLFYESAASWLGLVGVEKEGKLMGLASLGEPRYRQTILQRVIAPDAVEAFATAAPLRCLPATSKAWEGCWSELFGPGRRASEHVTQDDADIAASVQAVLEECVYSLLEKARRQTGHSDCACAGGVFLNAVANAAMRRSGIFDRIWVQPLAGDSGTSLGAALAVAQPAPSRRRRMTHAFHGTDLGDVSCAVREAGLTLERPAHLVDEVADMLVDGAIVGWAMARAEVGPRALGHRSILALPRDPAMRDEVNARVKEREPWRPLAPVVLEEDCPRLFGRPVTSPFMNLVETVVLPAPMPATVHVDGTARLQTVAPGMAETRVLRQLLLAVKRRTGYGVLLNTSLNARGEPIARTAVDAIAVFRRCGLSALVLGDGIVRRPPPGGSAASVQAPSTDTAIDVPSVTVLAPWWKPTPAMVAAALSRPDVAGHPAGRVIVVAVPVWSEVAADLLPSALHRVLSRVDLANWSVVLLDESGGIALLAGSLSLDRVSNVTAWWTADGRMSEQPDRRSP